METLLLISHALLALCLITLVLLQRGKGAEMGASFGAGASQTLFGSQGSNTFFIRLTAAVMALFFATSIGLAIVIKNKNSVDHQRELTPLLEAVQRQQDADARNGIHGIQETPQQNAIPELPVMPIDAMPDTGSSAQNPVDTKPVAPVQDP